MLEVYYKKYSGKITTEISYYFNINIRGVKKYYETIYESISDCGYTYSRYEVVISKEVSNAEKIENDVYRYTSILFENIKAHRRLSVLTKFILYIISVINDIPIYRIPKTISYYHDRNEMYLSPNAFIKTTYELIPKFEKIYKG